MPLRTTSDLSPSTRSAKVGERVEFGAKVENTAAIDEQVALTVEDLKEGALGKAVPFDFAFEPASVTVRARSRQRVLFAWVAALPEGKDAFTFRGKLVLRAADGRLVGSAPLDVYVAR